ncbi:MAG: hypothetical protein NUV88_01565 [Candidatus Kaiserbacteria bacterium]|nr:hypothetical protein [Candidatus Kaiserbacteria bacterium]
MGGGKSLDSSATAGKDEVVLNLRDNKGYAHEAYKGRAGFLSKEDYRTVLDKAREYQKGTVAPTMGETGTVSAQEKKDPLSSVMKMLNHLDVHKQFGTNNKQEVFLYQALKDFLQEHPEAVNRYQDTQHIIMTDEQILAEAYKILGDEDSLKLLAELKRRNRHPQVR